MSVSRKNIFLFITASCLISSVFLIFDYIALTFFPNLKQLSSTTRIGIYSFLLGSVYYLSSLVWFFTFASKNTNSQVGVTILGRLFKFDKKLNNPANHIALGTLLIGVSFIFIFAGLN